MASALVIPAPRRLRGWRARCRQRNLRHTHLPPPGSTTSSPASPAQSGGDSRASTADTAGRSRDEELSGRRRMQWVRGPYAPPLVGCPDPGATPLAALIGSRCLGPAPARLRPRPTPPTGPAPPGLSPLRSLAASGRRWRLGSGASQGGRDHPRPKNSA